MKTSLNISDQLFHSAKKKAAKEGRTMSEVLSLWAELGRKVEQKEAESKRDKKAFKPLSLGAAKLDLSSRKEWLEELDEDRT